MSQPTAWENIYHFLLYDGAISDILINYSLILLYTIVFYYPWTSSHLNISKLFITIHIFICITLQVIVWFLEDAYGVSLIWCGQLGLLIFVIVHSMYKLKSIIVLKPHLVSVLTGVGAVIYYAIVYPPITTVAHIAAVVVGCLMATTTSCPKIHDITKYKR